MFCCLFSQNSRGSDRADKVDLSSAPGLGARPLRKVSAKVMATRDYRGPRAVRQPPGAPTHLLGDPSWPFWGRMILSSEPRSQRSSLCASGRGGARQGGAVAESPEPWTYAQSCQRPLAGCPETVPITFPAGEKAWPQLPRSAQLSGLSVSFSDCKLPVGVNPKFESGRCDRWRLLTEKLSWIGAK